MYHSLYLLLQTFAVFTIFMNVVINSVENENENELCRCPVFHPVSSNVAGISGAPTDLPLCMYIDERGSSDAEIDMDMAAEPPEEEITESFITFKDKVPEFYKAVATTFGSLCVGADRHIRDGIFYSHIECVFIEL